jgi:hypothetical protein
LAVTLPGGGLSLLRTTPMEQGTIREWSWSTAIRTSNRKSPLIELPISENNSDCGVLVVVAEPVRRWDHHLRMQIAHSDEVPPTNLDHPLRALKVRPVKLLRKSWLAIGIDAEEFHGAFSPTGTGFVGIKDPQI